MPSASRLARRASTARACVVDEQRAARAARQRLDAEGARARVEVEHALAVERAEDREQRLADAVGRRARVPAGRRGEPPAPERAGDDPHAATGLASTARSSSASRACSGSRRCLRSSLAHGGARSSTSASSGSRAKRKRARPDWRVPVSSPSPRSSRSISASAKPSACSASALQALGLLRAEEQAQRRVLAAADAPAQLVQLRDAVALGVLDEHHGRVRHVDADLDDRRRHEHVRVARREALHRLGLLARPHLAVQQHDLEVLELGLAQPLELGGRRARLQRLGLARRAGRRRTPGGRRAAPRGCARRRARARARPRRRASRSAGGRAAARAAP